MNIFDFNLYVQRKQNRKHIRVMAAIKFILVALPRTPHRTCINTKSLLPMADISN